VRREGIAAIVAVEVADRGVYRGRVCVDARIAEGKMYDGGGMPVICSGDLVVIVRKVGIISHRAAPGVPDLRGIHFVFSERIAGQLKRHALADCQLSDIHDRAIVVYPVGQLYARLLLGAFGVFTHLRKRNCGHRRQRRAKNYTPHFATASSCHLSTPRLVSVWDSIITPVATTASDACGILFTIRAKTDTIPWIMKKDIHPNNYRPVVFEDLNNGFRLLTRSTVASEETTKWEDGNEYPLIKVHITSASHPFFTGEERIVDIEGRVDKFKARAEAAAKARDQRMAAAKKQAARKAAKVEKSESKKTAKPAR
jgi:large subunit ribosomal protein L31